MSGFFSLGGGTGIGKVDEEHHHHHHPHPHHLQHQDQDQDQQHDDGVINPYGLYLFKNEEIYSKRFELWQQYYQLQQHQHRQQLLQQQPHYDLGVGVSPSGRTDQKRSSSVSSGGGGGGVDDLNRNNNVDQLASSWDIFSGGRSVEGGGDSKVMRQGGYGIGGGSGSGSGSGSGGGINCQDCGNQAKKDCQHMRCRTCCKARGFHCQTHVKSTWVPAAKRREHQQQLMSLTQQQNLGNQQLSLMMRASSGDDQNPKRLREDHHHHHHQNQPSIAVAGSGSGGMGMILSAPQHQSTSSGLQVGHFPAEVNSPAVFRCVRVSAMNEAEEQLAYQTSLNVGGHVFKGILYDHGPEARYHHPGEGSSSAGGGGGGGGQHHQLNLITSNTTATTSINQGVTYVDPSSAYPTPFSAFMAGTQFFPPPRS
ncbi:unnamed protein product [Lactuca virosa]|uniref:Uncharacterized protein n=1 Tax=Lactuca virosa TaxID=75947 RepID=A0AAU9MJT3_9ASTR|nr:unnamed protein product [Lactuca virosa]